MEGQGNPKVFNGRDWQFLIESCCLFVELHEEELEHPVEYEIVQEANNVQHRLSTRVRHYSPQGCEILCIDEESLNFWTNIQIFKITLYQFFGVDGFCILVINTTTTTSVQALFNLGDEWSSKLGEMWSKGIDKEGKGELGTNVLVPCHVEVLIITVQDWPSLNQLPSYSHIDDECENSDIEVLNDRQLHERRLSPIIDGWTLLEVSQVVEYNSHNEINDCNDNGCAIL